jgi:hypothetical protein
MRSFVQSPDLRPRGVWCSLDEPCLDVACFEELCLGVFWLEPNIADRRLSARDPRLMVGDVVASRRDEAGRGGGVL